MRYFSLVFAVVALVVAVVSFVISVHAYRTSPPRVARRPAVRFAKHADAEAREP